MLIIYYPNEYLTWSNDRHVRSKPDTMNTHKKENTHRLAWKFVVAVLYGIPTDQDIYRMFLGEWSAVFYWLFQKLSFKGLQLSFALYVLPPTTLVFWATASYYVLNHVSIRFPICFATHGPYVEFVWQITEGLKSL